MTIDTTQPVDKRFKNNFNDSLQKMIVKEQIKILDNKIRSNQAQYDLDKQNTKTSALSSDELDKYEYLTGEDLGYKPDVVQKAKFEYSPLGQIFNKGLDTSEKQEGLLKGLKNIEDKADRQPNQNNDYQLGLKSIGYKFKEGLSQGAKIAFDKIVDKERSNHYLKLGFRGDNNKDYDFTNFNPLR